MTIKEDVMEYESLTTEIQRLRRQVRFLSNKRNECEKRIIEYLDTNEQPGVKMNDTIIMSKQKQRRKHRKKTEKIQQGLNVLRKYGFDGNDDTLYELLDAMRGSPVLEPSLAVYKQ